MEGDQGHETLFSDVNTTAHKHWQLINYTLKQLFEMLPSSINMNRRPRPVVSCVTRSVLDHVGKAPAFISIGDIV